MKRLGNIEPYDERKLYASVYAAALGVRVPAGEAELVAEKIVAESAIWLAKTAEVSSNDIFLVTAKRLEVINPDAAYMYKTHRSVS